MADYYTVLKKAIEALSDNTGEARRLVYDRARKALVRQLEAIEPRLSPSDITRQRLSLEESIRTVEAEQASGAFGLPTLGATTPSPGASAASTEPVVTPQAGPEPLQPATPPALGEAHAASGGDGAHPPTATGLRPPSMTRETRDFGPNPLSQIPGATRGTTRGDTRVDPGGDPGGDPGKAITATAADGVRPPPAENVSVNAFRRAVDDASDLPNRASDAAATARSAITGESTPDAGRTEPRFSAQSPLDAGSEAAQEDSPPNPNERQEPGLNAVLEAEASPYDDPEIGRMIDRPGKSSAVKKALLLGGAALLLVVLAGAAVTFLSFQNNEAGSHRAQEMAGAEDGTTAQEQLSSAAQEGGATDPSRVAPDAERVATRIVESPQTVDPAADPASDPGAGSTQLSQQTTTADGAPSADAAMPISERAILYEETDDPALNNTIAVSGNVVWRERQNPAAPASRIADVEITIPERNFSMTMVFRENLDRQVEASNILEVTFKMPQDYKGGSVTEIPGLILKSTENARGDLLIGTEVRIATNLFWLALSGLPADITANRTLLRDREWIDLPLKFDNGQRGLIAFEKGRLGGRVIEAVVDSWSATEPE